MLCDRLSVRDVRWQMWLAAVGGAGTLPFLALFLFWPQQLGALLLYIPAVVIGAFYVGPTFAMTQALAKLRMRAMASAIILFVMNLIGLGLGPQIVGVLNDLFAPRFGDEAIRYSLLIMAASTAWAIVHSLLAARTLREDLRARDA